MDTTSTQHVYRSVETHTDFPAQEKSILAYWEQKHIFARSIAQNEGNEEYVFYDGPPFATGLPHFGHFVPGTVKDVFPRYHTMCGKKVNRRFGWDCHGLPVEYEVEQELGISGKAAIESYGVARFNQKCRSIVLRYTKEWQEVVTRMGRWVDFVHDYKTMNMDYMESIWWVFKELWQRDYIYHGYYILPYSPGLATPLSNFEVNLGGYHEVRDPAITVRFLLRPNKQSERCGLPRKKCAFLAWTTTPWTLPSNLGLAVGANIEYVLVEDDRGYWILAHEMVRKYWKEGDVRTICARFKGSDLVGLEYEPLFDYFADFSTHGAFQVLAGDFVNTDEGTGIVHIAPAFGEDDYTLFKHRNIPIEMVLDDACCFTDRVPEYQGMFVKDADKKIISDLKERNAIITHVQHLHSYPFCWRTKKPLIYRAVGSWFVRIDDIKEQMLSANQHITWVPAHMQQGRFGKWLASARDWAISRNRYWGNPIPIWRSDGSNYTECIGSVAELEKKSGHRVTDIHKHHVDTLTWDAPDGSGTMRRIPEVLDCWFESGAMPYAQNHYPFENREYFEKNYPADFICEGLDQTRGWFYTLTVLSAALFQKPPARHIVVSGLVLDDKGRKMSKSERNYSDPREIIDTYGADALRLFLMRSNVVRGEDLKYSDDGVREVLRQIIIPLWSAYSFFITYANIDNIRAQGNRKGSTHPFDLWIYSECERLIIMVRTALDNYDLQKATEPIIEFIDNLNNWYIRRSRRRFWSSVHNNDKIYAYEALYYALMTVIKIAAPIIPFITEAIYQNIRLSSMPDSVHLCNYPVVTPHFRNMELEHTMRSAVRAIRMGRTLRKNHSLKNRQPLRMLYLISNDKSERATLSEMKDIIAEELNIKEIHILKNEQEHVTYSAKAQFHILGKQLGKNMKSVAQKISQLTDPDIAQLLQGKCLHINTGDTSLALTREHVHIIRHAKGSLKVLNNDSLTAIIDPEITEELRNEGLMRDIVRLIQRSRKSAGFRINDHIEIFYVSNAHIHTIITSFCAIIMSETLATHITHIEQKQLNGYAQQKNAYVASEQIDGAHFSMVLKIT